MHWVNPAHWRKEIEAEITNIEALIEHFQPTLAVSSLRRQQNQEWRNLQMMVNVYYKGVKASELWERILTRAGFDTRYLHVSRYFDSSIPIFCGTSILSGIELLYFDTSIIRYSDTTILRYFDTSIPRYFAKLRR